VRAGGEAIKIDEETGKPLISEVVCVGCGICIKKCPFKAISIVNLPEELEKHAVHRYGPNAFKLFGLPVVKRGKVLGLIGPNGVGKSTILKILAGKIKPNLGRVTNPPEWDEIIGFFRGSELQLYFKDLAEGRIRTIYKPQEVGGIPIYLKGSVESILSRVDEKGALKEVVKELGMQDFIDRSISKLSGGELQKLAIAITLLRDVDVYLFDEPSSFLDVKERLRMARVIRELAQRGKTVVVVEHDLAVLDYVSDYVCILYGEPSVYGIVSLPRSARSGINAYLRGFLREENMLIRCEPIIFHLNPTPLKWRPESVLVSWSRLTKELDGFRLEVESGEIHRGEVIGILGPNAIGKTTFVKILAGILKPDSGCIEVRKKVSVSYKPQFISQVQYEGTLREYLEDKIGVSPEESYIKSEYIKPLGLDKLLDRPLSTFSGGELQRAAIVSALLQEADIYLLDEPMAYLDVEQRFTIARIIRRITSEHNVATFIVEHDVIVQDYVSDTLMVFTGKPGLEGHAYAPEDLRTGMNRFLSEVDITFRRDPDTGRPRINKPGSWLDRYQKEVLHEYYYIPSPGEEGEEE